MMSSKCEQLRKKLFCFPGGFSHVFVVSIHKLIDIVPEPGLSTLCPRFLECGMSFFIHIQVRSRTCVPAGSSGHWLYTLWWEHDRKKSDTIKWQGTDWQDKHCGVASTMCAMTKQTQLRSIHHVCSDTTNRLRSIHLNLNTWWMLRNSVCLELAGGVGWGWWHFFELEHMVDATQLCLSWTCGWGGVGMMTFFELETHGGCYATLFVLNLHVGWVQRNVIIPTPPHPQVQDKQSCVASTMCSSSKNVIIPAPPHPTCKFKTNRVA